MDEGNYQKDTLLWEIMADVLRDKMDNVEVHIDKHHHTVTCMPSTKAGAVLCAQLHVSFSHSASAPGSPFETRAALTEVDRGCCSVLWAKWPARQL